LIRGTRYFYFDNRLLNEMKAVIKVKLNMIDMKIGGMKKDLPVKWHVLILRTNAVKKRWFKRKGR